MSRDAIELKRLLDDLHEEPIDEAEVEAAVNDLGVDVAAWAADLRAKLAANDDARRAARFAAARAAYAEERREYARLSVPPGASLDDLRANVRALVARAPAGAVSAHFHKFETADVDELASMVRALKHLLGESA